MTERTDMSFPSRSAPEGETLAWHRPASGSFEAPAGRPGRARADLPARTVEGDRPPTQPLRRRGRKSPEVPLMLKPADPTAGLWTRASSPTNRPPDGKGRRRRTVLATRETVAGPVTGKWIGPTPREELERNPFVALEALIFGNPAVSEGSWKRSPAEPEPREWPLPPARPKGELTGRPLPRRKMIVPLRGRR